MAEANSLAPFISVEQPSQPDESSAAKSHPLPAGRQKAEGEASAADDQSGSDAATTPLKVQAADFDGSFGVDDKKQEDADAATDPLDDFILAVQDPNRRSMGAAGLVREAAPAPGFASLAGAGAGIGGAGFAGASPVRSLGSRSSAALNLPNSSASGGVIDSPKVGEVAAGPAPEPQAWTLLILGFGLTGASLRRLRRRVA